MSSAYSHHRPLVSSSSSQQDLLSLESTRPPLVHKETDIMSMLDYYHTSDANKGSTPRSGFSSDSEDSALSNAHIRKRSSQEPSSNPNHRLSTATVRQSNGTSGPDYHSATSVVTPTSSTFRADEIKRKPSLRAAANADNRRLAIIELNSSPEFSDYPSASSSEDLSGPSSRSKQSDSRIHSRRGQDPGQLALMAPPDASPYSYSNLSPPIQSSSRNSLDSQLSKKSRPTDSSHKRSKSSAEDALPSRDIGVVGATGAFSPLANTRKTSDASIYSTESREHLPNARSAGPGPSSAIPLSPVFQTPTISIEGRGSPESADSHGVRTPPDTHLGSPWMAVMPDIITPAIGQTKELGTKVAGPTIHNLSRNEMAWVSSPIRSQQGTPSQLPLNLLQSTNAYVASPPPNPNELSYMFYDPMYGTAGPPPSPPKEVDPPPIVSAVPIAVASPPPPRPPRLSSPPSKKQELSNMHTIATRYAREQASHELPDASQYSSTLDRVTSQSSTTSSNMTGSSASSYDTPNRSTEGKSRKSGEESRTKAKHSKRSLEDAHSSHHRREGASSTNSSDRHDAPTPAEATENPYAYPSPSPPVLPRSGTFEDLMAEVGDAIDDIGLINARDLPPATVLEPPWETKHMPPPRRDIDDNGRIGGRPYQRGDYDYDGSRAELALRPRSRSPVKPNLPTPPPSGGSDTNVGGNSYNVVYNHKRSSSSSFSSSASKRLSALRKTTSNLSLPRFAGAQSQHPSPRSGQEIVMHFSPPLPVLPIEPTRRLKRKVVGWSQAMQFDDVVRMKSALDRAAGYAEKINELAALDLGLEEWATGVKNKKIASNNKDREQAQDTLSPLITRSPSGKPPRGLARHVSRSSVASEATFPMRPDAYHATNLGARSVEESLLPDALPPALPYPSLAHGALTRSSGTVSSSARTLAPSSSLTLGLSKGGFFASIGRKASMKRERGLSLNSGPTSMNRPPISGSTSSQSRPAIHLPTPPKLLGGPRAPPHSNRLQKTASIAISSPTPSPSPTKTRSEGIKSRNLSSSPTKYESAVGGARPPLHPARSAPQSQPQLQLQPLQSRSSLIYRNPNAPDTGGSGIEFEASLQKLVDVLPHVERTTLAIYLRKSGNDMAAISAYLEDERSGRVVKSI